jgi:hypothetical protein
MNTKLIIEKQKELIEFLSNEADIVWINTEKFNQLESELASLEKKEAKEVKSAEEFVIKKYKIDIMPNELTFFHEKLFELMEEYANQFKK